MRGLGFKDGPDDRKGRETKAIDLTYLGLRHFRFSSETARIASRHDHQATSLCGRASCLIAMEDRAGGAEDGG
jgi:hypothetical protein